jgi:hypothetical protein
MDWKIRRFEEGTDYDPDRGFYRFKRAIFEVDGTEHSIRVSMKDFDEGKATQIVEKEAKKIIDVLGQKNKKA